MHPILCVGTPKSGTHALTKAVELLGIPRDDRYREGFCSLTHALPDDPDLPHQYRAVMVIRDPRNMLISMVRWRRDTLASGFIIGCLHDYEMDLSLADWLTRMGPWLQRADVVVRYEDLIESDAALRRIANALGLPYLDDAFSNLPGLTLTWNSQHSDWRKHWTPEIEAAWQSQGLDHIALAYGYHYG